jgi:hypothetical protein
MSNELQRLNFNIDRDSNWDEWFSMPLDAKGSAHELAGLLLGMSRQESADVKILYSSRIWVFKRAILLCKQIRAEIANLAQCMIIPPNYKGKIKLTLNDDIFEKLTSADPFTSKRKGWHWLRGLYGSCGNIFSPKSGYFLVLRIKDNDVANKAGTLLELGKCDFSRRINNGANEIMIRKQENTVHFLSGIGMNELSLRIEDMAIFRAMKDRANKIVNCDSANISKSIRVAEELVAVAKMIKSTHVFEKLPNHYKELIEVRLENPEATLSEIGSMLVPSISKSTVKYRWDRLQSYAKSEF